MAELHSLRETGGASRQRVKQLNVEMLQQEYRVRQEVSKEFTEQLTVIEEEHE